MKELWFPYLILHDNQNINFYKARPAFQYSNWLVFIHYISKLLFMARPLVNVESNGKREVPSFFGVLTSNFWVLISYFRCINSTSEFELPTSWSDFSVQISDFRLLTSDFWLHTSKLSLSITIKANATTVNTIKIPPKSLLEDQNLGFGSLE